MRIQFTNQHPEGERVMPGAFDGSIGKEVPLKNEAGEVIGTAKILAADVDDNGLTVTYETDANLGLFMDLEVADDES